MQKAHSHPAFSIATEPDSYSLQAYGFRSISLRCSRFFSPFPHGTGSLSVSCKYLALPDGPGRFTQNFTCSVLLRILLGNKNDLCTGLSPSMILSFQITSTSNLQSTLQSYNPQKAVTFWVWAVPRSLATTKGITDLFYIPSGTQMFQFSEFTSFDVTPSA